MSTSMLMLGTIFAFFLVRNQTLPPVSRIAIVYPVPTDTIDIWYLTHPFDTMYRWTSLSAAVVRFVQFCYCSTCSALSFFTSFTSSIILLFSHPCSSCSLLTLCSLHPLSLIKAPPFELVQHLDYYCLHLCLCMFDGPSCISRCLPIDVICIVEAVGRPALFVMRLCGGLPLFGSLDVYCDVEGEES